MKLSLIIPAHNEEEIITDTIKNIEEELKLDYEIIVVNDNSTDNTVSVVKELMKIYSNLRLVENDTGQGFASALKKGFSVSNSDLLIPVMADLCDDISTVEIMLNRIKEGYDIVCGCRYIKGGARLGGPKLKGFFSCLAGHSLYYLLGLPTHDIPNSFKMYRKKVIDSIDIKSLGFEVSMEITVKAYYLGFRITDVPTVWKERTKGKSNFKMSKLLPGYLKLYFWAIFKKKEI